MKSNVMICRLMGLLFIVYGIYQVGLGIDIYRTHPDPQRGCAGPQCGRRFVVRGHGGIGFWTVGDISAAVLPPDSG